MSLDTTKVKEDAEGNCICSYCDMLTHTITSGDEYFQKCDDCEIIFC